MPYDERYESDLLRWKGEVRPWDILEIIREYSKKSDILLDIGCGTAFKLIKLVNDVGQIYGIEPNEKMQGKANENILKNNISNIKIIDGNAQKIPFADNCFDIVTSIVAPHDINEMYRVLKPSGYLIIETSGDRDKWNIKQEFGLDKNGPRGQLCELLEGEKARNYERDLKKIFQSVSVRNGFWKSYYSIEGLILLFELTPAVRGFNRNTDSETLKRIEDLYSTQNGIETTLNRILIIAQK